MTNANENKYLLEAGFLEDKDEEFDMDFDLAADKVAKLHYFYCVI